MPRKIYLIRHGETDWNRNGRFQGQSDIALNDAGRSQAAQLSLRLAEALPFDRLVASDLRRARETAEILHRGYDVPIVTDEGLREMNFGRWEGLDFKAIQEQWPLELQDWVASGRLAVPDGENEEQLYQRVWKCFQYWADKPDYRKMAMVFHGGACGALLCGILGRPPQEMRHHMPANTGIHLISVEGPGQYSLETAPAGSIPRDNA
jgi:alpha-ribazole phosphatase